MNTDQKERDFDVIEMAYEQARHNLHPWETRIKYGQCEDGLPHPILIESTKRKEATW